VKTRMTRTIEGSASLSAEEMRKALEGAPDDARVRFSQIPGDRGQTGWQSVSVTWEEES